MLWCVLPELDLCLGLVMIILLGLTSLRHGHVCLSDVQLFCLSWPLLRVFVGLNEHSAAGTALLDNAIVSNGLSTFDVAFASNQMPTLVDYDILLCLLTVFILRSFQSFESLLMILMAFIGGIFMLHSCDLVTFYVCLEMQNFGFLVLCALQPDRESSGFSVEASLKYLLLSAFSSGMCLYWFSVIYGRTGQSVLLFKSALQIDATELPSSDWSIAQGFEFAQQTQNSRFPCEGNLQQGSSITSPHDISTLGILLALLFKLGTAPMHLWMVDMYGSLKKPLLLYLSTAPKLSMICFWVSAWHHLWTDSSIGVFVCLSMVLGSLGAYGQPALRALFAYSTVNEIGLMLLALETAGFHSLFQHLCIYIVTQLLLWNIQTGGTYGSAGNKLLSLCAISLAGLPPLAGFFGKAWIFWHAGTTHSWVLLATALVCTGISLVYYLRVLRLFWR